MRRERKLSRGRGYYSEPILKLPDNIPLTIAILYLLAKKHAEGIEWVAQSDIQTEFEMMVPHKKAYYILSAYLRRDLKKSLIRDTLNGRSVYKLSRAGYCRVIYYKNNYELPDWLLDPITKRHLDKVEEELKSKKKAIDRVMEEF